MTLSSELKAKAEEMAKFYKSADFAFIAGFTAGIQEPKEEQKEKREKVKSFIDTAFQGEFEDLRDEVKELIELTKMSHRYFFNTDMSIVDHLDFEKKLIQALKKWKENNG